MNKLTCPQCCDIELTEEKFNETPVLVCSKCSGIWMEKGHLNKVAHPIDGDLEYCTHEYTGEKELSNLLCPRCNDIVMQKVAFIEYSDIKIDFCPECEGLWLNKDSLQQINDEIDALAEVPESWDHKIMVFLSKLPSF